MATLKKIAAGLGAEAATIEGVVKDVDAIIFSMPFIAYKNLPKNLLSDLTDDVVVMDTSNYYPFRDGEIPELETMSESEYISKVLNRKVTKVFNNILKHTLKYNGKEEGAEDSVAISVEGDNKEHKKIT